MPTSIPNRCRWIYLLAAIPFFLLSLLGTEYGAGAYYVVPILLCVVQYFLQAKALWGLVVSLYAIGVVVTFFMVVKDAFRLMAGGNPEILTDASDTVFFIIVLASSALLLAVLIKCRPAK